MIDILIDFCKKNLSACIFGLYLLILIVVSNSLQNDFYTEIFHLFRYDVLFFLSLWFQFFLLITKLETPKEFLVIIIFHLLALFMEIFKVTVGSWVYPEPALFQIASVPIFAGFMYSAVGSYIARIHQGLDINYINYPNLSVTFVLVGLIYLNFFTHHYFYDMRWVLTVFSILLFYKTSFSFVLANKKFSLPVLLLFIVLAILIWFAENIATYSNIWLYPNQVNQWKMVSFSKISSWYLLMLLSFVLVMLVNQKRIKS